MDVGLGIVVDGASGNFDQLTECGFETVLIRAETGRVPKVPRGHFKRVLVSMPLKQIGGPRAGIEMPVTGVGVQWPSGEPVDSCRAQLAALPERIGGAEIIFDIDVSHALDDPARARNRLMEIHASLDRPLYVGIGFGRTDPYPWVRAFGRALRYVVCDVKHAPVPEMLLNAMVGAAVRRCDVLFAGFSQVDEAVALRRHWEPGLAVSGMGGSGR